MSKKLWGVKCALPSCGATKRQFPELRFFKFPGKETARFAQWIQICQLNNISEKTIHLCSRHFSPDSFANKNLKKNAVPTLSSEIESPHCEDIDHIPVLFSGKTYNGPKITENFDLFSYSPRVELNNENNCFDKSCSSCLKFQKNSHYYYLENIKLQNKITILKKQNAKLNQKNRKLRFQLRRKKECFSKIRQRTLTKMIDSCNTNQHSKTLGKMILCKENRFWKEDEKSLALNIHYKSPSVYKYLRNVLKLNLPSESSLHRWLPIKNLNPGLTEIIKKHLKCLTSKWSAKEKEAVLIFDDLDIKRQLCYDQKKDEIIGFVDLGDQKLAKIAKRVIVFMVRGLLANWKFYISYYATERGIISERLSKIIKEVLDF